MEQQETLPCYDVFVIGGGINGVGIARDAVGRGLSVCLAERGDLAQGTSSASSKMIHGGLRYLEYYEFRLVREALKEREVLLAAAPHIIWPLELVLPHNGQRPLWMVRMGLFLYDHLAKRKRLKGSYGVDLSHSFFGKPLKKDIKRGFVYSDCWVEDARLVVLSAVDAAKRGARIMVHTEFMKAEKLGDKWQITLRHGAGHEEIIQARYLVNAAGPRVDTVAAKIDGGVNRKPLRLIKGSHIIVPRLYEGEHAYLFQNRDNRVIFAFPFEDKFTLIGTTDQPAEENEIDRPKISQAEMDYLIEAVNGYFTHQLTASDVVHTYSGIRPLYDDGSSAAQQVTRDYVIQLENNCLSVFGGKITTYRRLSEEAVDKIAKDMARNGGKSLKRWTAKAVLPGGDLGDSPVLFTQNLVEAYPFLPEAMLTRYATQYGRRAYDVLKDVTSLADMGQDIGDTLYAREVDFLVAHEWAIEPEDILLRRSKIGIRANSGTKDRLAAYLKGIA